VNKNTRNILNWIVIAMMVMLPLRGVIALDQSACEMHDEASEEMVDHSLHTMHLMTEGVQMDANESQNCCSDLSMNCNSDCGIGMSVSFLMQSAIAVPAQNETAFRTHVNNNLVFRDLAPPIRPPASLQI
jgi:hypothetical protein